MKFSLKKKTALLVTIIALTIAVVAAAVSYRLYAGTMDTRYKNSALDIARTAAALSDSDAVARYADAVLAIYRQDPAPEWTDAAELSVATQIQADMLPSIFPAFPNHPGFDIYATMTPAKEVGGDFYDFFLVDEDHLCLVMADVSGKGVPAALFMVIAKTLLKNSAQTGMNPARILETVNNQLCDGNQAEMFVTTWLGILQLSTGRLVAANAGHEYPVCRRAGGDFALVKDRHGFVQDGKVTLRFEDDGKPFDPLAAAEPDTTLSAEERNIGGLGVFLVKRMMDEMHYERRQEKNCLTLSLHLPGSPRP